MEFNTNRQLLLAGLPNEESDLITEKNHFEEPVTSHAPHQVHSSVESLFYKDEDDRAEGTDINLNVSGDVNIDELEVEVGLEEAKLRWAIRGEILKTLESDKYQVQERKLRKAIRGEIKSMIDSMGGVHEQHWHNYGTPNNRLDINRSKKGVTMGFTGVGFKNSKAG